MRHRLKTDLQARIADSTLPNRAKRWLEAAGIATFADLVARTPQDLLVIPNFAFTSLEAVQNYLADRGLSLAPERTTGCPQEWVAQAMEMSDCRLEKRERDVLKVRFGLGQKPMTLEQAGRRLKLTRERVRQIQKKAEAKVMAHMIYQCGKPLPTGVKPKRRRVTSQS
jgi:hypothetical protein